MRVEIYSTVLLSTNCCSCLLGLESYRSGMPMMLKHASWNECFVCIVMFFRALFFHPNCKPKEGPWPLLSGEKKFGQLFAPRSLSFLSSSHVGDVLHGIFCTPSESLEESNWVLGLREDGECEQAYATASCTRRLGGWGVCHCLCQKRRAINYMDPTGRPTPRIVVSKLCSSAK